MSDVTESYGTPFDFIDFFLEISILIWRLFFSKVLYLN